MAKVYMRQAAPQQSASSTAHRRAALPDAAPSAEVVRSANQDIEVTSKDGRRLTVRSLTPRKRMNVFAAIGPELSANQSYWGVAMLAVAVISIDGESVTTPNTRREIEALVDRLGDDGLFAVGRALAEIAGIELDEQGNVRAGSGDEKSYAKN